MFDSLMGSIKQDVIKKGMQHFEKGNNPKLVEERRESDMRLVRQKVMCHYAEQRSGILKAIQALLSRGIALHESEPRVVLEQNSILTPHVVQLVTSGGFMRNMMGCFKNGEKQLELYMKDEERQWKVCRYLG